MKLTRRRQPWSSCLTYLQPHFITILNKDCWIRNHCANSGLGLVWPSNLPFRHNKKSLVETIRRDWTQHHVEEHEERSEVDMGKCIVK